MHGLDRALASPTVEDQVTLGQLKVAEHGVMVPLPHSRDSLSARAMELGKPLVAAFFQRCPEELFPSKLADPSAFANTALKDYQVLQRLGKKAAGGFYGCNSAVFLATMGGVKFVLKVLINVSDNSLLSDPTTGCWKNLTRSLT
jgi:hypothetical protein